MRASGCNLRCWFCDTPYTSWQPEGEDWSVEAIVEEVERLASRPLVPEGDLGAANNVHWWTVRQRVDPGRRPVLVPPAAGPATHVRHVVITGGEPMLFAEMIPLCQRLSERVCTSRSRRPARFICRLTAT